MQITLVLDNIRSVYNVGAILRSAEGFGVKTAVFSGYTPFPGPRPGVLPHVAEREALKIAKTALGAEKLVKCLYEADLPEFLKEKSDGGACIVALENNIPDTIPLHRLKDNLPKGREVVLILGEEVSGVSRELFHWVDFFAEIPMRGQKESFNVSVATGIALYELTGCSS